MGSWRPEIGDRVPGAEALVTAAFSAFDAQNWTRLIELTDPGSLVTLKAHYIEMKRIQLDQPPALDEAALASDEIPRSLRDWILNRKVFGELAEITTMEEVIALDYPEFLTRWAQARHPRYESTDGGPWNPQVSVEPRAVVGSVAILPDTAAVLVRMTKVEPLNTLATISLIAALGDNAGGWTLDASSGWLGMFDFIG